MTATREEPPQLYRSTDDRLLGGVCSGLARHLGIDPVVARLALLALAVGGIGVAVYLVLLLLVPPDPEAEEDTTADPEERTRRKGRDISQILAYIALAAGLGMLFLFFGGVLDPLLWFLVFGALGGTILWQQANPRNATSGSPPPRCAAKRGSAPAWASCSSSSA